MAIKDEKNVSKTNEGAKKTAKKVQSRTKSNATKSTKTAESKKGAVSRTTKQDVTKKQTKKSVSTKKNEPVISETRTEKKENKLKILFSNVWSFIKRYKIAFGILSGLIILIIFWLIYLSVSLGSIVLTIDGMDYSKADLNMSLYNLKYSYFGKESYEIPDATLEEQITSLNMTVSEYLKQQAVLELKISTAIEQIALKNEIKLSEEDYKELEKEKKEVVRKLGGWFQFKKFLYKNGISEKAYDKYRYINKLYECIYNRLYAEGKANDLTDEELTSAYESYKKEYHKIRQIVLAIIDTNTGEALNDTTINQKEALANSIVKEVQAGSDFAALALKYSEESENENILYYTSGQIFEVLETEIEKLDTGSISGVIKTDYAYHIVQKLELDDAKLAEYYETKRTEKLTNDINKWMEDYKVIYQNAYKKVK